MTDSNIQNIVNAFKIPEAEKEIIQKEASTAEKSGRLTSNQLSIVYKNRWFHLLVPKQLEGEEMALPQFARLMESLAAIDGSFAWNVNLGAGANMFAGFMDQNTASDIFAGEQTCVAGSGAISGTAKRQNGGFVINGHWKYASGSAHANYFSLNAELIDSKANDFASFLVPAMDVEVLDTWNVFGMKATSSCDFKVNNVWIPDGYSFDLQKPSPTVSSALYRFPFMLLAEINMLVIANGLAIHFHELILDLAKEKRLVRKNKKESIKLFEHSTFKDALREVEPSFWEKRNATFNILDRIWKDVESENTISELLSSEFSKSIAESAKASRQLVDALYPFAGMKVIFEDNEISRVYRDFKVASQHALLSPTVRN